MAFHDGGLTKRQVQAEHYSKESDCSANLAPTIVQRGLGEWACGTRDKSSGAEQRLVA